MQRNARFRPRFVAQGAAAGPPPTPAVLSVPIGLPLGDTSAYVGVTSDLAGGTMYYVVTTSATPPSAAQIIAGQDHTGSAAAASGNGAAVSGAQAFTATGLTSNTAYYAYRVQNNGANSNVLAGSVFTTLTTGTSDTSFDNILAAFTTPATTLRQGYIGRLVQALYAGSCWGTNDILYVCAAETEQAGQTNWMNPGTYTLTLVNSPTFTVDRGFNGNGTSSYCDTNFAPATDAVQFTQNNASVSVYQRTGGSNGNEPFTVNNASFNVSVAGGTGTSTRSRMNNGTDLNGAAGGTQPIHGMGRRNDSTNASIMRDGVQVTAPTARTSAAIVSGNMRIGVRGNSTFVPHQVAACHMGAYLDDTQALAFYNALYAYMVAVGADT